MAHMQMRLEEPSSSTYFIQEAFMHQLRTDHVNAFRQTWPKNPCRTYSSDRCPKPHFKTPQRKQKPARFSHEPRLRRARFPELLGQLARDLRRTQNDSSQASRRFQTLAMLDSTVLVMLPSMIGAMTVSSSLWQTEY